MTEPTQFVNKNDSGRRTDPCGLSGDQVVVHNAYYAKPGLAEAVYQWRLHASDVRVQLGFPPGRVLRRIEETGDSAQASQPDVIWECTYPNLAARQRDAQAVEATTEFQAVMQHMRTLIHHFDRQIWHVNSADA